MNSVSNSLQILRKTARKMESIDSFQAKFEEFDIADENQVRQIHDIINHENQTSFFQIPDKILSFYSHTGGFVFEWVFLDNDSKIAGRAEILPLFEIFLSDNETNVADKIELADRIFDRVSEDFCINLDLKTSSLSYHCPQYPSSASIEIESYIDCLAKMSAIYGWQHFLFGLASNKPNEFTQKNQTILKALDTH
jgi:hypothetical protein